METKSNHKKVKRGKSIKDQLEKFRIFYVNMRGLKTKVKSSQEMIQEERPTLIALTETNLKEKEELKLEGYRVIPKNVSAEEGGRGLIIAVRNEIKHITSVVMEEEHPAQQMWVKISNQRIKIRIGLIYAPQESRTRILQLKPMYDKIEDQIQKGKINKEKVLVLGDFNCKIGTKVQGKAKK